MYGSLECGFAFEGEVRLPLLRQHNGIHSSSLFPVGPENPRNKIKFMDGAESVATVVYAFREDASPASDNSAGSRISPSS